MKSTPRRNRHASHPCMFRNPLIKDIDRHIQHRWAKRFFHGAPFGRLRLSWKELHCAVVNPYRSIDCPYEERDCALAFWKCAEETIHDASDARHAVGYFRMLAKRLAFERAENKPLARERSGYPAGTPAGAGAGSGLPRTDSGPQSIGDLLRSLNPGSRPKPIREDGETCPE